MKILVTGGAGYVGSILIPRLLAESHDVRVLDNLMYHNSSLFQYFIEPRFEFVRGSVTDRKTLVSCAKGVQVVIHLAGIVGFPACKKNPDLARRVNFEASKMLAETLSRDIPIIFSSTCSVYGEGINEECTEESPPHPLTLYGETKAKAEECLLSRGNTIIFRFATAFGMSPRMRLDLLINSFVYEALWRKYLIVYEKNYKRGFIHVVDMANTILFALRNLDRMTGGIYNAGSSAMNLTKEDVAKRIQAKLDFYLHFADVGTDEDRRNYSISYRKLEALGYEPKISLDRGLDELIRGLSTLDFRDPYSNM